MFLVERQHKHHRFSFSRAMNQLKSFPGFRPKRTSIISDQLNPTILNKRYPYKRKKKTSISVRDLKHDRIHLTPASPTMPMAMPAERPARPQARPDER